MKWTCKPCRFECDLFAERDRITAHLATKKHKRLANACPRCSSTRPMKRLDEQWDRDGIRDAKKCVRCKTEFKSFAHGIAEKDYDEYSGERPAHVIAAEAEQFHREATRRGYVRP